MTNWRDLTMSRILKTSAAVFALGAAFIWGNASAHAQYGYYPYAAPYGGDIYSYYNMGAASAYGGFFGGYGPYPYYNSHLYDQQARGVAGPDEVEGAYTPLGLVGYYYGLPDPF